MGVTKRPADAEIQGWYCPLQDPRLVKLRLASGKCIVSSLGLEKLCAKCGDYWPMDTEFWFTSRRTDGLFTWCRACYMRRRWPRRGMEPVVPLATQVFEVWKDSRDDKLLSTTE